MGKPKEESSTVDILLEGLDENSVSSLLEKWGEVHKVKLEVQELEDALKDKIKAYLKERDWDRYSDDRTKISVSIKVGKKQIIDKKQLKIMLTDAQYAQVLRTTTFERTLIITPEARERMKKYV